MTRRWTRPRHRSWVPAAVLLVAAALLVVVLVGRETGGGRPHLPPSPAPSALPPPLLGWPGPGTTGVPPHTVLHRCATTLTRSMHYDGCLFDGSVWVRANNVVISRSLVRGQLQAGSGEQQHGLRVIQSTIDATGHGSRCDAHGVCDTPPAVSFANFTLLRVDVFGAGHGVQITRNVSVVDSWVHGLCCVNAAHKDGIISNGGRDVVLRHNNVACDVGGPGSANYCSAALGLFGDFAPLRGWTVVGNLFNTTGGYCLYGGSQPGKPYPVARNMNFTDNVFGQTYYRSCGRFGPAAYVGTPATDVTWTNNVWADGTRRLVRAPPAAPRD